MTRTTPAARQRMVEQWRRSPLPGHEFARSRGVSLGTLYNWRRAIESGTGFVEIVANPPGAGSATAAAAMRPVGTLEATPTFTPAVEIATPAGLVVRFAASTDEALLRRVLRAVSLAQRE